MPLQGHIEQYSQATLDKAFWLQRKIKRDGIEGIHYMRTAKAEAAATGPSTVASQISVMLRGRL